MWGRTLEESVGKSLLEIGYEPWHAEMHEREIDRVIATKQPIRGEVAFPHATLGRRIYDYIFVPVLNEAGNVEAIAGTTRDVTERKEAEQHRIILVDELNHRVKNTLATVQSIVSQVLRGSPAPDGIRDAIESRLVALAISHDLLTRGNWEPVDLKDVIRQIVEPFAAAGATESRFHVAGPEVRLRPKLALALGMAFHELATNAVKYGALSSDSGQVAIDWTVAAGRIRLSWVERDGPPVTPPTRRGFGSRLIERGLAREVGGSVRLDYTPRGVVCEIEMPAPDPRQS